jgi:hypothetical protein
MSSELLNRLTDSQTLFMLVGGLVALSAIVAGCIKSVVGSITRERTRREIAAYIAEKSMTPEEGERLMAAGGRKTTC